MIRIYLKQAWFLLRENKLLTAVSVGGTALAICLIMVIVIVWQIRVASYSPEDYRDRMLFVNWAVANGVEDSNVNNSAKLGSRVAKECLYPLETAEAVGIGSHVYQALVATTDHAVEFEADMSHTDAGYWRVFNFRFLAGKPYDEAAVASGIKEVVVSASTARRLFGTTDAVGKTIEVNYVPYVIRGVVRDVSRLAEAAYADVWVPYTSCYTAFMDNVCERLLGIFDAYLLAPSAADRPKVKAEALANIERMNASQREFRLKLFGAPDDITEARVRDHPMLEPPVAKVVARYVLIIAIILLIPAINMSGLTLSRMRKRMAEIGVRRAFGATRRELVTQILCENLLQTLMGGVLGLVVSYVMVAALPGWLLAADDTGISQAFLNADMLFNPVIFALAFLACLLLNLLSAGIPAWRSARAPIVRALNNG